MRTPHARHPVATRVHGDVEERGVSAWEAVYAVARTIPRGRVMTYGQISTLLGGRLSPAAVGWALHVCPEDVPWHRVVNAAGRCSTNRLPDMPLGMQEALLRGEGVEFSLAGAVDLESVRHDPGASPRPGGPTGETVAIREATRRDAATLLDLKLALDVETDYMLLAPGERTATPDDIAAEIEAFARRANSTILVADPGGDLLAGYLQVDGGAFRRTRHVGVIVVGIRRAFWRRGIARRLFAAAEAWARGHDIRRLELTVMAHNAAAIALYRSAGFEVEGRRRRSLRVGRRFVDELAMARLI